MIRAFGRLTGVPVVINTSFNVRGEPIVCTPQDAYNTFVRPGIDALVIGDFLVTQQPGAVDFEAGMRRSVALEAESLGGALTALTRRHPALEVHLFDDGGGLRQHVLCFHNDVNSRWLDSMDVPLAEGDRITILQAVSGG